MESIQVVREAKILGIWFLQDDSVQNITKWNFNPILNKISSICASWSHRTLSLKGKKTVINSLIASLLQYPCASIFTPPQVYKEYRKIITRFIWNGRQAKVAYKTLVLPITREGLNLLDLETRVQINLLQWPKRVITFPDTNAACTLAHLLQVDSISDPFMYNWPKPPEGIKRIPFYLQMFRLWAKIHCAAK